MGTSTDSEQRRLLEAFKRDGDTATVSSMGQPELKLKRVDGKWKVPASEFAKNVNPAEVEKGLDEIAFQLSS